MIRLLGKWVTSGKMTTRLMAHRIDLVLEMLLREVADIPFNRKAWLKERELQPQTSISKNPLTKSLLKLTPPILKERDKAKQVNRLVLQMKMIKKTPQILEMTKI